MAATEGITFHELYERYGAAVYRFALHLCRNGARAEDLTSECFLRVWSSPVPVRLPTARSYLLAVVRNLFLEDLRRRRKEEEPLPEDLEGRAGGVSDATEARIESRERLQQVMAAMRDLPEMERSALLLRSREELSYEEIGAVLGLTTVAARVKVHRARQRLLAARLEMERTK